MDATTLTDAELEEAIRTNGRKWGSHREYIEAEVQRSKIYRERFRVWTDSAGDRRAYEVPENCKP
jgi:hypothetical protein